MILTETQGSRVVAGGTKPAPVIIKDSSQKLPCQRRPKRGPLGVNEFVFAAAFEVVKALPRFGDLPDKARGNAFVLKPAQKLVCLMRSAGGEEGPSLMEI